MRSAKWLWLAPLAAFGVAVGSAQSAQAEPLTPLTPNEIQFLDQLRIVFAAKHDPAGFRSDGELLTDGQFVCAKRNVDQVGGAVNFVPPAVTQLAFIYLCP